MKYCPKCNTQHDKKGTFCSRTCANSRGPRTEDFKKKVSKKLTGTKVSESRIIKRIESRGQTVRFTTLLSCAICNVEIPRNRNHRKTCSDDCYVKLVTKLSQENPNCGGQKHTHRVKFKNIHKTQYTLESSYEVRLAHILNNLNILWIRPEYFIYNDKNDNKRRYYPDFYLPEFDVYLDPKNSYLIKTDIDKIIRTSHQNKIKIIILGDAFIDHDKIKDLLVGNSGNAPLLSACKADTLLLS